ncbi:hypothetical protein [Anatilimnocola floriformis]|uniref:hypothetical protein n=1 Tax=Anatilimnocola floriformis TaxID=2948575 RepID=UPI0020C3DA90|nr:hypothetical protein [Anatilimnocola floriformis]
MKPQTSDANASNDAPLAACMLIDAFKQIRKCELVSKLLKSEEARTFARVETEEHEQIAKQLKKSGFIYAEMSDRSGGGKSARPGAGEQFSQARGVLMPGAAQLIEILHEVAEQCVGSFKFKIQWKEGLQLDKRFIGDQLNTHYMLLDKAQVFKTHATSDVRPLLEAGVAITQKHIAILEDLMVKLEKTKT